jgi:hypothetical protein
MMPAKPKHTLPVVSVIFGISILFAGCAKSDRKTAADTVTSRSVAIPVASVIPVASRESVAGNLPSKESHAPVTTVQKSKPTVLTKVPISKRGGVRSDSVPRERDSVFRPKAAVDENGTVHPIKRAHSAGARSRLRVHRVRSQGRNRSGAPSR